MRKLMLCVIAATGFVWAQGMDWQETSSDLYQSTGGKLLYVHSSIAILGDVFLTGTQIVKASGGQFEVSCDFYSNLGLQGGSFVVEVVKHTGVLGAGSPEGGKAANLLQVNPASREALEEIKGFCSSVRSSLGVRSARVVFVPMSSPFMALQLNGSELFFAALRSRPGTVVDPFLNLKGP